MDKEEKKAIFKITVFFLLGVIVGFSLILMGIIFLMIAVLSSATTTKETLPATVYYLGFILFELVGSALIYYTLKGSPEPGIIDASGKFKDKRNYFDDL